MDTHKRLVHKYGITEIGNIQKGKLLLLVSVTP
jgi:hypothetical protein